MPYRVKCRARISSGTPHLPHHQTVIQGGQKSVFTQTWSSTHTSQCGETTTSARGCSGRLFANDLRCSTIPLCPGSPSSGRGPARLTCLQRKSAALVPSGVQHQKAPTQHTAHLPRVLGSKQASALLQSVLPLSRCLCGLLSCTKNARLAHYGSLKCSASVLRVSESWLGRACSPASCDFYISLAQVLCLHGHGLIFASYMPATNES